MSGDPKLPITFCDTDMDWEYSLREGEAEALAQRLLDAVAAHQRGEIEGSWTVASPAP